MNKEKKLPVTYKILNIIDGREFITKEFFDSKVKEILEYEPRLKKDEARLLVHHGIIECIDYVIKCYVLKESLEEKTK